MLDPTTLARLRTARQAVTNAHGRLRSPLMDGAHVSRAIEQLEQARADLHVAVPGLLAHIDEQAREISRLQAGGCARDQRTTQFCAEAAGLAGEVKVLKELFDEFAWHKVWCRENVKANDCNCGLTDARAALAPGGADGK